MTFGVIGLILSNEFKEGKARGGDGQGLEGRNSLGEDEGEQGWWEEGRRGRWANGNGGKAPA